MTRAELDSDKRPVDFRQSVLGALETLTYAGRPVESVTDFNLSQEVLDRFEVLVLPEVEVLTDGQAEVVRRWVDKGGALVASYRCGLLDPNRRERRNFPLADVLGVNYESEETDFARVAKGERNPDGFISTYIESVGHPLADILRGDTVGLPGTFVKVRRTTAEEVMQYRLPFFVEDLENFRWFNWGPPRQVLRLVARLLLSIGLVKGRRFTSDFRFSVRCAIVLTGSGIGCLLWCEILCRLQSPS